jgi:mannose-6-phosphate isomerase
VLYPFKFKPIFKERVWGGRNLETLYRKPLPPGVPIGESWEISDRPGDASVIANGALTGKDLRWLIENHQRDLLGDAPSQDGRFPLLIKILDAQEKLSLQVHPPAQKAAEIGGEPKTEMWHIAQAAPGAELYVGLKHGVTRKEFERRIQDGTVADCFHRVPVSAGDTMFLPSGRVHAIGAGLVIFEIQQNSDTTYRVFDWNRVGTDGKPRDLHVAQSLASIDFNDFEPALVQTPFTSAGPAEIRSLAKDPLFNADLFRLRTRGSILQRRSCVRIVGVLEGRLVIATERDPVELQPGEFCLLPATLKFAEIHVEAGSSFLQICPGESGQ